MARRRVAILISGGGSNLQALLDAAADTTFPAEIVLVVADRPQAGGLERARSAGVAAVTIDHRQFDGRGSFEAAIDEALAAAGVDLVCLAGFMRVLTEPFVRRWADRMLNIHPSLLPAFRGLDTHARALAAGVRLHGCTVHLVRPELDDGPILVQGALAVRQDDDAAGLAARVLVLEHRCYPLALRLWAGDRVQLDGERIVGAESERLVLDRPLP